MYVLYQFYHKPLSFFMVKLSKNKYSRDLVLQIRINAAGFSDIYGMLSHIDMSSVDVVYCTMLFYHFIYRGKIKH